MHLPISFRQPGFMAFLERNKGASGERKAGTFQ